MILSFAKSSKKIISGSLVIILILGVFMIQAPVKAEEEMPLLTKEAFIARVLADNSIISSLETQIDTLEGSIDALETYGRFMGQIYSYASQYKSLSKTYAATAANPTYLRYLILGTMIATGIPKAADPDEIAEYATIAASLTGEDILAIMDVPSYVQYLTIGDVLVPFGVSGQTLTPQEEYDIFITPIFVTPSALKSAIKNLEIAIESTKSALSDGASQLYDTVIMLEGLVTVLDKSYLSTLTEYNSMVIKESQGLGTTNQLTIAKNEREIARLNRDKLQRDVSSLKMNMNVMMSRNPQFAFLVSGTGDELIDLSIPLETPYFYKTKALAERNELMTLQNSIEAQQFKLKFVKDLFLEDDNSYQYEVKQMDLYKLDVQQKTNAITVEIYNAYNNVLEKGEALEIAKLDLAETRRQFGDLESNVKAGFVTTSTLGSFNIRLTQVVNDVATKSRDYLEAYKTLLNASSVGPGYTN